MDFIYPIITIIQIAVSFYLTGLIWTVQLVHYPAFKFVSPDNFIAFHRHHSSKMTAVVMIPMLLEIGTLVYLCIKPSELVFLWYILLAMVVIIWAVTFLISVPCHNQLGNGKDETVIDRLIRTNWFRTILWSIKSIVLCYLLYTFMIV